MKPETKTFLASVGIFGLSTGLVCFTAAAFLTCNFKGEAAAAPVNSPYQMTCTDVLENGWPNHMRRCENQEIACYLGDVPVCQWKGSH